MRVNNIPFVILNEVKNLRVGRLTSFPFHYAVIPNLVPYERRVAIPHDFGESGLDTGLIGNPDKRLVHFEFRN